MLIELRSLAMISLSSTQPPQEISDIQVDRQDKWAALAVAWPDNAVRDQVRANRHSLFV